MLINQHSDSDTIFLELATDTVNVALASMYIYINRRIGNTLLNIDL